MKSRLFEDTTQFFLIDDGDEIVIDKKRYRVIGHAREMRFGIEDPKFWVKRVLDTETGERKIIKLVYFESFETKLGGVRITCFRNPDKEGEILDLVRAHPYFMQGSSHRDIKGNNVRVLDYVRGPNFLTYIGSLRMKYEVYFNKALHGILIKLVRALEAIRFLHINGFRHGDIRNDHIIVEGRTGNLVWIDFDYDFAATENPFSLDIFGIGNILLFAIGKGFHNVYMIKNDTKTYGDLADRLEPEDLSLLEQRRLCNLRRLYPCIPRTLNNILMHFSGRAEVYYEFVDEIIEDLNRCLQEFI